jgi:hypothetical protein
MEKFIPNSYQNLRFKKSYHNFVEGVGRVGRPHFYQWLLHVDLAIGK